MLTFAIALIAGAGVIYVSLGALHLLYTFHGNRFHPHDPELKTKMEDATLRLTRQTSIWKAWIGFNASHSTGAMFFGFMLVFAAWAEPSIGKHFLVLLPVAVLHSAYYTWLARAYWFRIPLIGCLMATLFLAIALSIHITNPI